MEIENRISKILPTVWYRGTLTTAALFIALFGLSPTVSAQRYSGWAPPENGGPVVNSATFDGCPSLSRDGRTLLYHIGVTAQDLYVSHRETADPDAPWSPPQPLGPNVNTGSFGEICPTLSISGRYLYFASDRPGGCGAFDIYVARRLDKHSWIEWEEPVHLGCAVNSPGPEFSPSIFEGEDGTVELFFSSGARPGGLGLGDIWMSRMETDGSFTAATPVVTLNTSSNDLRPKIRARDGLEIFFDSNRAGTIGAQDIYTSTRECLSCPWSVPQDLGAIVNSTLVDGGAALSFDGTELYFMSNRTGGSGDQDIWVTRRDKLTGNSDQ